LTRSTAAETIKASNSTLTCNTVAEAGLQNSASNRTWLTIAEKRALTFRSLPRPILSTAVRMLS
jgi:hypothetical protein